MALLCNHYRHILTLPDGERTEAIDRRQLLYGILLCLYKPVILSMDLLSLSSTTNAVIVL